MVVEQARGNARASRGRASGLHPAERGAGHQPGGGVGGRHTKAWTGTQAGQEHLRADGDSKDGRRSPISFRPAQEQDGEQGLPGACGRHTGACRGDNRGACRSRSERPEEDGHHRGRTGGTHPLPHHREAARLYIRGRSPEDRKNAPDKGPLRVDWPPDLRRHHLRSPRLQDSPGSSSTPRAWSSSILVRE